MSTPRFRSVIVLAAVMVLAVGVLGAVGCMPKAATTSSSSSTPVKGGTLSYYIGEPAAIDPYNAQETEGVQVVHQLFRSLTDFDDYDATKLVPAAASTWTVNADATVWTFHLNPADKFSDGNTVTAQDFIYAWNRIANPNTVNTATKKADPSQISYHLAFVRGTDDYGNAPKGISGLKALDANTLQVTLKAPFAEFDYVVAHPGLAPVEKSLVEGGVDYNGSKVAFGEMPVGNGPFKMSQPWKHNQYIKVVASDTYYGAKPYLAGVNFMEYKDPDTAYLAFQSGALDFSQIGTGKIKDAESKYGDSADGYTSNPGKQVLLGAENSVYYLLINNKISVLNNLKFREALSLAINRQAICDTIFQGSRQPADNIVPPGIAGYQPGAWQYAKYDVAAAEKALADAGYPGGKGAPQITLAYNADGGHQPIMELVQADLTKIGLKVKLNPFADFPTYLKALTAKNFMVGRLGWVADYPIIDDFMNPLFRTTSSNNYFVFPNKTFDAEIDAARKMTDPTQRLAAYQALDKQIGDQVPVIPLMFYKHHHVVSSRVHNFIFSSMYLADLSKCWISK